MASKKITPRSFRISFLLSVFFHGVFLSLLLYGLPRFFERPSGRGDFEFVSVSLVKGFASLPERKKEEGTPSKTPFSGLPVQSPGATYQEGGQEGTNETLRQIQRKIEQVKYYPLMAKRSQIEGVPEVEFKIKDDGTLEYVRLRKSSGFPILDEAATKTVHQATPLPYYPEPIALNIRYTLNKTP